MKTHEDSFSFSPSHFFHEKVLQISFPLSFIFLSSHSARMRNNISRNQRERERKQLGAPLIFSLSLSSLVRGFFGVFSLSISVSRDRDPNGKRTVVGRLERERFLLCGHIFSVVVILKSVVLSFSFLQYKKKL